MLHYKEQTAHIDRHAAQSFMRAQGCDKPPSQAILAYLEEHYEEAADRARRLDAKHDGDDSPPGSNPSSTVWRLVESIRSA